MQSGADSDALLRHLGYQLGVRYLGTGNPTWAVSSANGIGFQAGPPYEVNPSDSIAGIVRTLVEEDSQLPAVAPAAERPRWEVCLRGTCIFP